MIFDKKIELELLESQPEWIGVNVRIENLRKEFVYWNTMLDKDPKEWVSKKINKIDEEIKFFENIILFWASNYDKLERLGTAIERQLHAANKGTELMDLINDLREAHEYERNENIILSETFIKLAETKTLNGSEINNVMTKLRDHTKKYLNFINTKINKIVDEQI